MEIELVRLNRFAGVVLACFTTLIGCDDPSGIDFSPMLVQDTVVIAAPLPQNAALPTALDITGDNSGSVGGGRFPERPSDAQNWDFAVRIRDGQLALVPARAIGLDSRAAITQPLVGETFEGLREAPGQSTFTSTEHVVLTEGAVYVARSRETSGGFLGVCVQFAKLSPLEVDVEQGLVTLQIVTNEQCGDPRLALE